MAENIKSRKYYRVHNGTDWDRMHFVTDANSVDANDGDTMETKVGAFKGITTSTNVTEEGYAADATTVAALNSSLGNVVSDIYVGSDGKLHKVIGGADSVLPFSSGYKYKIIQVTGLDHNCNYTHTVSDQDVTEIVAAAILYAYTGPNADGWGKNAIINVSVSGKNIKVTTNVTSGVYFYYKAITFLIVYK